MGNSSTIKKALERLDADFDKSKIKGTHASAVADGVKSCIETFCRQDEEFAEFVSSADGTIVDCVNNIGENISGRSSVSDLEVYKLAVKYYFSTADVGFHMTIDLAGSAKEYAEENGAVLQSAAKSDSISLSFEDLFGGI